MNDIRIIKTRYILDRFCKVYDIEYRIDETYGVSVQFIKNKNIIYDIDGFDWIYDPVYNSQENNIDILYDEFIKELNKHNRDLIRDLKINKILS